MRILHFEPGAYRNLPARPIHFHQPEDAPERDEAGCSIRFLVGKNGTGKTNILRFLASIFLALEEDYRQPHPNSPAYSIPYRLRYELHQNAIEINSSGEGRRGVTFTINGIDLPAGDIPSRDQILPGNILVYTSGDYRDWQNIFTRATPQNDEENQDNGETRDFLRPDDERDPNERPAPVPPPDETDTPSPASVNEAQPQPNNDDPSTNATRQVNLASASQLKWALLAALLDQQHRGHQTSALYDSLKEVNIQLIAFSLELTNPSASRWYIHQLESLKTLATRRLQEWQNERWVYDLNQIDAIDKEKKSKKLADAFPQPFQFYQLLCDLKEKDVLRDASLIIEYTPHPQTEQPKRILLSDELSDGELAFISRMALISLLNEEECLFLLDEPEVHFNDDWKRNLVDSIERALTQPKATHSEVILTTHASIVLTDAYRDEIILMTYAGQEIPPRTLGGEPGELLQSVLGAPETVGKRAIRKIQKALESKDKATLEAMLKQVGPGYYRFAIIEELQRVSPPEND